VNSRRCQDIEVRYSDYRGQSGEGSPKLALNRIPVFSIVLVATLMAIPRQAQPAAENAGMEPILGKWKLSAKDTSTKAIYHGTLEVTKADQGGYQCNVTLQAVKVQGIAGKAMQEACKYNPQTRRLTFSGGGAAGTHIYYADLAADGTSLDQGKWKEIEKSLQGEQWVETGSHSGIWFGKRPE
jgi:hypothetical protein